MQLQWSRWRGSPSIAILRALARGVKLKKSWHQNWRLLDNAQFATNLTSKTSRNMGKCTSLLTWATAVLDTESIVHHGALHSDGQRTLGV